MADIIAEVEKAPAEIAPETDEEARKRMRVQRLRQQTVGTDFNIATLVDKEAGTTAKQETLDKIQIMREVKKQLMLRNFVN